MIIDVKLFPRQLPIILIPLAMVVVLFCNGLVVNFD